MVALESCHHDDTTRNRNCLDSYTYMRHLYRINKLLRTMCTSLRVLFAFPKYSVSPDTHRNRARLSANVVDQSMF